MSLLDAFFNHSLHQLVVILESGADYTFKAKEAALEILKLRELEPEELKNEAIQFWEQQINENIKSLLLSKHKPTSSILSEEEMGTIFKKAFDNWKENQKTFEVDTTKYWFV